MLIMPITLGADRLISLPPAFRVIFLRKNVSLATLFVVILKGFNVVKLLNFIAVA